MRRVLFIAASLTVTAAAFAIADEAPVVSSMPVATPLVSSMTASAPIVSTAPVPTVTISSTAAAPSVIVSSPAEPVDHVDKAYMRRVIGMIKTIDPASYKLVVVDQSGQTSELILTKRTRVNADDGSRLSVSNLKAGDKVNVRYVENYNFVRKIDLLP